jgi:hypothetical protein
MLSAVPSGKSNSDSVSASPACAIQQTPRHQQAGSRPSRRHQQERPAGAGQRGMDLKQTSRPQGDSGWHGRRNHSSSPGIRLRTRRTPCASHNTISMRKCDATRPLGGAIIRASGGAVADGSPPATPPAGCSPVCSLPAQYGHAPEDGGTSCPHWGQIHVNMQFLHVHATALGLGRSFDARSHGQAGGLSYLNDQSPSRRV